MLRRSLPRLIQSVKLNLYKSMVFPVLLYGSVCWFAKVTHTNVLDRVKKKEFEMDQQHEQ